MKIYLKFSVKLAKMMYNVSQWESSSIPKFSTMPNEGESKPLYRFELNSSLQKDNNYVSFSSPRNRIKYYICILPNKLLTKTPYKN